MGLRCSFLSSVLLLYAFGHAQHPVFEDAQDTLQSKYGEIIFSATVFRHGDRYAMGNFPNNPHWDLFKAKRGLMTEAGKLRAHTLGRWTRVRYDHLIGGAEEPYDAELLDMISSPSERVLLSGRLFLAGFHRPDSEDQEVDAPWKPIPTRQNDRMITMREYCPRYNVEIEIIKKLQAFTETIQQGRTLLEAIKTLTGLSIPEDDPIVGVTKVSLLYDTLKVMKELDLQLPAWWPELYSRVQNFAFLFYQLHTFNHVMRRLKAGPLLSHIVNELKAKRDQLQSKKRIQFYAGHDSNIVALLDVLGVWDGVLAAYCSAIFFELRKLDNNLSVTVSFRNSEDIPPVLLNMPGCQNPCSLDNFIQYTTDKLIPRDWDSECQTTDYNTILF